MKNFKIEEVSIELIDFLEKNAHYMPSSMFRQLVDNIKKDKQLSSVPFCVKKDNGRYKVISGNHRIKAAKLAGLSSIYVMYVLEAEITNDEILAIQLSHNSINGNDDLETLRELVNEIQDVSLREYAFIDEQMFDKLDSFDFTIPNISHEVFPITFMFYDIYKAEFDKLLDQLNALTEKEKEYAFLMPAQNYEKFSEVVSKVKQQFNLKAFGLAILKMAEITKKQLDGKD